MDPSTTAPAASAGVASAAPAAADTRRRSSRRRRTGRRSRRRRPQLARLPIRMTRGCGGTARTALSASCTQSSSSARALELAPATRPLPGMRLFRLRRPRLLRRLGTEGQTDTARRLLQDTVRLLDITPLRRRGTQRQQTMSNQRTRSRRLLQRPQVTMALQAQLSQLMRIQQTRRSSTHHTPRPRQTRTISRDLRRRLCTTRS